MRPTEHRIGRLVFEVSAPDAGELSDFSQWLRSRFDSLVAPALDRALERIDRPGQVLRLDRVEIDLGRLDPQAQDLGSQLARRLAAALATVPVVSESGDGGTAADVAVTSNRPSDPAVLIDELVGFLETGTLRWIEPGRALDLLISELMALSDVGIMEVATALRVVLLRARAVERLICQIPLGLLRRLLRAMAEKVLDVPSLPAIPAGPNRDDQPVPVSLIPLTMKLIGRLTQGTGSADPGELIALLVSLESPPRSSVSIDLLPDAEVRSDDGPPAEATTASRTEALATYAAGSVLLYPFLATFVERLGLVDANDRFRDRDAQVRAVLLVHHLATGADRAPEPELPLFKLLCGLPLSHPVPQMTPIGDHERAEALVLLESVIEHWKRLGNTRPQGLREGFLLRPGRLVRSDDGWRLTVEQRGIDVLLDHLPWSLSRVKTPFMTDMLAVEWR